MELGEVFKVAGAAKEKVHKENNVIVLDNDIPEGECPFCKGKEPWIFMPKEVSDKVWYLTEHLDTEWIGVLKGYRDKNGNYAVEGIEFPKQTNSSAHTKAEEPIHGDDIIGWIHSHNSMGVFFSSEDDETNKTLPIGIVVNKKHEWKACATVVTKCGRELKTEDAVIDWDDIDYEEMDKWFQTIKEKLEEKKIELVVETPKDEQAEMTKLSKFGVKEWEQYERDNLSRYWSCY